MAKKKETWIDNAWRPAIAWSYLVICIFDFFVAPIISAVFQSLMYPHQEYVAWKPNTLAEGGLYHMAMMAIVGVTAWTRAQEKMMRMGTPEDDMYEEVTEEPEEEVLEEEAEEPPPKKAVKKVVKKTFVKKKPVRKNSALLRKLK